MRIKRRLQPRLIKATVFRAASVERLKDAECLHKAGRFNGAIYLCGYALECRLKFCICEVRRTGYLEEGEAKEIGHDLFRLLDTANLRKRLSGNKDLLVAFQGIIGTWSPEMRYSGRAHTDKESERFLRGLYVCG